MNIEFKIYLNQQIQMTKYYLASKILKPSPIDKEIYKDILTYFNDGNSIYKLYIKNAPIGEVSLRDYLRVYSDWEHSDRDLQSIYLFVLDYLNFKFSINRKSIRIISNDDYLEVHKIK
jgi:hypothetical protein